MGSTSLGQYELLSRIAHGGMAEIFLAKRRGPGGFDKRVVIKRVLPHLTENENFVRMFLDEARLVSRLSHPNIIQIFDFGVIDGIYFLCMEHLDGEDLATVLRVLRDRGELMPPQVAASILSAACDGMHYAHTLVDEEGQPLRIVHRDLSPSNLFLTLQGAVKVLDFGVAQMEGKLVETQSGVVKGKFAYLSPEQALGNELDLRSDVFALGLILHEALTGQKVFKRATEAATLRAVLEEPIEHPRKLREDLPEELNRIVMKALARSPLDRWQSAQEMRTALDEFLSSRGSVPAAAQLQAFMQSIVGEARASASALTPAGSGLGAVLPPATAAEARLSEITREDAPGLGATSVERTPSLGTSGARRPAPAPLHVAVTEDYQPQPARHRRSISVFLAVILCATVIAGGWWLGQGAREAEEIGAEPAAPEAVPETGPTEETAAAAPAEPAAPPSAGESAALAVAGRTAAGLTVGQAVSRKGRPGGKARGKGKAPGKAKTAAPAEPPPAPATGRLDVNCKPFCRIHIDGEDTGKISPALGLVLPEGDHLLKLVNPPTQLTREKKVRIEAGKTARVTITF
ncbi:MAG: protein kinase [Deltaproteobacteria bacterium]|nr:protein kinase [Deltaproteobacteria bacterium]